jgi:hypothetical protein
MLFLSDRLSHEGTLITGAVAMVKLRWLMRLCDAFFLFSTPRTAKRRVGRANDLVHVYYASIFGWLRPLAASPLAYVEVTAGLRRTPS